MKRTVLVLAAACNGSPAMPSSEVPDAAMTRPQHASPPAVVTHRYDMARTGANLEEVVLQPGNVSKETFGLLYTRAVRGQVYAQPLFVPALEIAGRRHDVVFVATEHDDVYAFDADDPSASEPLWHVSLGTPMPSSDLDPNLPRPYPDLVPEVGITGTPVIDLARDTMYLVAKTKENDVYANRLHAMSILDGSERPGSPGDIDVPPFWAKWILQRPALGLANGVVWIAGGGHADEPGAYTGWVQAFDASTLAKQGAWMSTPHGHMAGIWQSGMGIALDGDGAAYFITGNGTFRPDGDPPDLGDSFGRLSLSNAGIHLDDWFTPFNASDLDAADNDLGSSGPVVIPNTNLVVGGGKEGKLYVLRRDAMGHQTANDAQIVQSFQATFTWGSHIHSAPVFWNERVYFWGEYDVVRGFRFLGDRFETEPFIKGTITLPPGMPGGMLSLSANGKENGIVWAMHNSRDNDGGESIVEGTVRAFDANDLHELWNSDMDPRDAVGLLAKFCPPMVADGKVFVPTFSDRLQVYGLKR